ncbi:hypothetical protein [Lysobacter gummosus]|uniref:hypothetical protein n=1 Tax=Lysobacter gummosus TaxID=262324 RepID=UPI0036265E35
MPITSNTTPRAKETSPLVRRGSCANTARSTASNRPTASPSTASACGPPPVRN